MTISLIPETAPFSADQRAWLNGFFAGLLSMNQASGNPALATASAQLATVAQPGGTDEEQFPWHDPALPMGERLALAESQPLQRRLMAAMAQLDCGACGYVCQTYGEALARGEEKDVTRCSPGGTETAKVLKQLVQLSAASSGCETPVSASRSLPQENTYSRTNPYSATLKSSYRLTHPDAAKDTRHVIISLAGSGITYRPGDALGILPENAPDLVEGILSAFPSSEEELVSTPGGDLKPFREALRTDFALSRARAELLSALAVSATNSDEAQYLRKLLEENADDFLGSMDVLDVLTRFSSARPTLEAFVAGLGKLQPRLYSISSALEKHPEEVHLTVGVVRYEAQGKWFHGVASNFLGVRSLPGDTVRVFVQPAHRFQLPSDPSTPIIMVGPGTGIAPFRSFLEYREATGAGGKNWLFFGNQYRNYDYLYAAELNAWRQSGLLTRLDLAFSRDTSQKVYVQDRIREQGAELWKWMRDGAYFYVCGDAKRMAPDVDLALQEVGQQHGGLTADAAKRWVQQLAKEKRYLRDVY